MKRNADSRTSRKAPAKRMVMMVLVAALFVASLPTSAQDVVVTVSKMRQNLPVSLTELIDHPNQYLNVTLQNTTAESQKVYLKLNMSTDYSPNGAPLEIHTQDRGQTRPVITLAPYEVRRFTQINDFQEHFGAGRLSTNATADFMTLTRIPEGDYELCMEVFRWQQTVTSDGDPMSRSCVHFKVCYTGSAPEITAPVTGVSPEENIIAPRRFMTIRWTSVITNCPNAARFNYYVKIVKVPASMTPDYAISHAPVIFSRICKSNTYCQIDTLRNLEIPFEFGATYAVQVEARDANNSALSEGLVLSNDGKSQVVTFSWGTPDYEIDNSTLGHFDPLNGGSFQVADKTEINGSTQDKVLASFRKPYICHPFRDASNYSAVLAAFSDELSKVPDEDRDAQIKYNGNYDDHIANPRKSQFDIKWMPIRGNNITRVHYTVDLFDDIGTLANIDNRTPLAIKSFDKDMTAGAMMPDYDNAMSLADTTWEKYLLRGRKYVARVVANVDYTYEDYTIEKIVHYVHGIEADTEYDTTKTPMEGTTTFSSTLLFQWGIIGSPEGINTEVPVQITLQGGMVKKDKAVELRWNYTYGGSNDYRGVVYRSDNDSEFRKVGTFGPADRSFLDRTAPANARCTYYVQLQLGGGNYSTPSNHVTVKTKK